MSPSFVTISPGIMVVGPPRSLCSLPPKGAQFALGSGPSCSWYWVVYGDELRAVGERRLDLDLGNHLGHALHHLVASQYGRAEAHQVRDRASVASAFEDRGGDECRGLRVIDLESAREPPL